MGDGVFNIAKGRVKELHKRVVDSDPTNAVLTIVLLKVSEADATLEDYDDLNALLGAPGNVECDFTNYPTSPRRQLDQGDISHDAPDDSGNVNEADIPDQTFTAAGGATNNTLVKVVICFDNDSTGGNDTNLVPLTHHDFTPTTNGNDLIVQIDPDGYFRAA